MTINYRFKNFNPVEKNLFKNYFETKLTKLEQLTERFSDDAAKLQINAEKFATKEAYKVTFKLNLPKDRLMASEDDHTIYEAIDLALDKLIVQLRKVSRSNKKKKGMGRMRRRGMKRIA